MDSIHPGKDMYVQYITMYTIYALFCTIDSLVTNVRCRLGQTTIVQRRLMIMSKVLLMVATRLPECILVYPAAMYARSVFYFVIFLAFFNIVA